MKKDALKKWIFLVFALVFVTMLVFNFMTPLVSDDFAHYFGTAGRHPESLEEMLSDLAVFRMTTNGRVISHFFVYLFLALPKAVFNVVNAAVAALLLWLMSRFYRSGDERMNLVLLLCSVFAMWCFTQAFGNVFLWLTGSCNYSWGLALDLLFLYPFYCRFSGRPCRLFSPGPHVSKFLFCFLAFIVGAYSENGAAAVIFAAALFGLLCWISEKKLPILLFVAFLFSLAGFAFLMLAPATGQTRVGTDLMRNIWFIRICLRQFCLVLFAVYAVALALSLIFHVDRKTILATVILVAAGGVSIVVFVFAAYLPERSFYVITTFLILATLMLLDALSRTRARKANLVIACAALVYFAARFPSGASDIVRYHGQSLERDRIVAECSLKDGKAVLPAYVSDTMYSPLNETELSEDPEYWYNELVAKYYGLVSVTREE